MSPFRAELSHKNPYWIEKHRRYELIHFCLQYPIWKKAYHSIDGLMKNERYLKVEKEKGHSDPTARCVEAKEYYRKRMDIIEDAAKETDSDLWSYILRGVTENLSYDKMAASEVLPCSRDRYYELYRKFFWILNKIRE